MIGIIFSFYGEIVEIRLDGLNCLFKTKDIGGQLAPLESLKLDYKGVCKEFPDLKDRDDWRQEAIKRFKEKLKTMETEDERIKYIIEDFKKWGYIPLYKQRQGHRLEKIK